jgi:dihydrolipoyl dehydrogenase
MKKIVTKILVIGGGPAGYVAAIRLGQLNIDAVIVEKNIVGGVCLNVGCIPSKVLISAGRKVTEVQNGERFGIEGDVSLNLAKLQEFKESVVKKLTTGVRKLIKANGTTLLSGKARFLSRNMVAVDVQDDEEVTIEFEKAIICTGSVPSSIGFLETDGELVIGSKEALSLTTLPKSMVVVGGGVIGLELGQFYASIGCEVTVVEAMDQILPGTEKDLVKVLMRSMKKMGMKLHTSSKVKELIKNETTVTVKFETKKGMEIKEVEKVLVTIGRKPYLLDVGLENIGLDPSSQFIEVNSSMETKISGIYAAGDVTGNPLLAHRASAQAEVAAEHISGRIVEYKPLAIPGVCYTTPEIAVVGLTQQQAMDKGIDVKVGKFMFGAIGRALVSGADSGFIRYLANSETDVIVGVQIVGHEASELISEAIVAVEKGITAGELGKMMHAHPTLGEAAMEAARVIHNEAIHQVPRR